MTTVSISTLLDAGVHFGHQTRRWNPKMKPYIFGSRGDIYILDLKQTLVCLDRAYSFVTQLVEKGGTILFVGTKKQAQEAIADAANRCGMPYVNTRWLGGTLTNFDTIHSRVARMEELETMEADGSMAMRPKKEQIKLRKELDKLQTGRNGIRDMKHVPDAVFIIDTNREEIAVREAVSMGIPIIGTLDTNCDPDNIEYGIPANDDAIRSVRLLVDFIADAVMAGRGNDISAFEMGETDAASPDAAASTEAADAVADAQSEAATPAAQDDESASTSPEDSGNTDEEETEVSKMWTPEGSELADAESFALADAEASDAEETEASDSKDADASAADSLEASEATDEATDDATDDTADDATDEATDEAADSDK